MTISPDSKEVEQPHWFVMNAYNAEKKVETLLLREHFRYYIPKHWIIKQVRTTKKCILVPVIPSLVFVYSTFRRLHEFQSTLSFFSFATMSRLDGGHSTMKVPDAEMDNFIRITSHSEEKLHYFRTDEVNLKKGQRVRIVGGIFDGVDGVLVKVKGIRERRLVVSLPNVTSVAATHIEPEFIQLI